MEPKEQRRYRLSISLLTLEAIISNGILLLIPRDPNNTRFFGYSTTRFSFIVIISLAGLFFLVLAIGSLMNAAWYQKIVGLWARLTAKWARPILYLSSLGVAVGLLAFLTYTYIPEAYVPVAIRLYPVVFFFAAASLHFFILAGFHTKPKEWQSTLFVMLGGVLAIYYFTSANYHATYINRLQRRSDQDVFISFAHRVLASGFTETGGRNQMPLYAYLQALFLDPERPLDQIFMLGKQLNIVLSMLLLAILYPIFRKYFGRHERINLFLIVAFSIFIYRAGYLQPELLYYFFAFLGFLYIGKMLAAPTYLRALFGGLFLALGYLTKASVLPAVFLFVVMVPLKELYILYNRRRDAQPGGGNKRSALTRVALTRWASFALLLVTFLGILSPYLRESKQIWGKYFFNVNTTFYIWYDTFTEAKQGTRAHGEGEGWPNMPPEEIPSLQKYLREHTPAQILDRIRIGLGLQAGTLWRGYGLFNFHLFYLAVLLVLTVLLWRQNQVLIRAHLELIVYSVLYFIGYIFSIAWYYPIGGGENQRFTFALFTPFMFATFLAVNKMLAGADNVRLLGKEIPTAKLQRGLNWFVSLALAVDILIYVPIRIQLIVY